MLLWCGLSKNQTQCSRSDFSSTWPWWTITLLNQLIRILLISCHNAVLLTHGEFAVSWNPCRAVSWLVHLRPVLMQFLFAFPFFPLLCLSCIFLHFSYHFSAEVLWNYLVSNPRLKSRQMRICLQEPWRLTLPIGCLPGWAFQCCIWWMNIVILSLTSLNYSCPLCMGASQ